MEKEEEIGFFPNRSKVLESERVVYRCDGPDGTLGSCLFSQESAYPESVIDYLNNHLKANPGHTTTIKACDIDNS